MDHDVAGGGGSELIIMTEGPFRSDVHPRASSANE